MVLHCFAQFVLPFPTPQKKHLKTYFMLKSYVDTFAKIQTKDSKETARSTHH